MTRKRWAWRSLLFAGFFAGLALTSCGNGFDTGNCEEGETCALIKFADVNSFGGNVGDTSSTTNDGTTDCVCVPLECEKDEDCTVSGAGCDNGVCVLLQ